MKKTKLLLCMIVATALAVAARAQEAYKVIAHPSVPVSSMSSKDLTPLFLKKATTYAKWGSSQKVVPFDQAQDSGTREAFTKAVHQKPVMAVKAYWQQQIFSGRGTPPVELDGDGEVMAAVARTAGGIGYVGAGATLRAGVKVIRVTD